MKKESPRGKKSMIQLFRKFKNKETLIYYLDIHENIV